MEPFVMAAIQAGEQSTTAAAGTNFTNPLYGMGFAETTSANPWPDADNDHPALRFVGHNIAIL